MQGEAVHTCMYTTHGNATSNQFSYVISWGVGTAPPLSPPRVSNRAERQQTAAHKDTAARRVACPRPVHVPQIAGRTGGREEDHECTMRMK